MQKQCKLDSCEVKHYAKGFCRPHYDADRLGRPMNLSAERQSRKPRTRKWKACSVDGCTDRSMGRGWCNMHFDRWYTRKQRGLPDDVCNDVARDLRETFVYDMEPEEELAQLIFEQERDMRYKDFAYPGTGETRVVVSHSVPLNDDGFDMLNAIEYEQAETNLYGGRRRASAERASDW